MDYKTRKVINNLAGDILKVYNISVPITDMEKVVVTLGGSVRVDDNLIEADGRVKKIGDSFEIVIRPNQSQVRKNFTIAHEIGHLFLHMGEIVMVRLLILQR